MAKRMPGRDEERGSAAGDDGGSPRSALGYAKPQTYEELRAVLASGTIHFPKRLRQVAIFLWQHPQDVALGTIGQVAEQAGVQPSTLVRFAKIFGYSGFSDFQGLFKEHVKGARPEGRGRAGGAGGVRRGAGGPAFPERHARRRASLARPGRHAVRSPPSRR